jgi:antitoxin component of RelBE/YafQ-DinJ toxin-antitoxin module
MKQSLPVKTDLVRLRVDPKLKLEMERVAASEGFTVSEWLRRLAVKATERSVRKVRR